MTDLAAVFCECVQGARLYAAIHEVQSCPCAWWLHHSPLHPQLMYARRQTLCARTVSFATQPQRQQTWLPEDKRWKGTPQYKFADVVGFKVVCIYACGPSECLNCVLCFTHVIVEVLWKLFLSTEHIR